MNILHLFVSQIDSQTLRLKNIKISVFRVRLGVTSFDYVSETYRPNDSVILEFNTKHVRCFILTFAHTFVLSVCVCVNNLHLYVNV